MNIKPLLPITLAALALTMAGSAWSRPHGPEFPISIADLEVRAADGFARVDDDGNGEVSPEEFASFDPDHRGMGTRHSGGRYFGRRNGPWSHGRHMGSRGGWDSAARGDHPMEAELFAALDTDGSGELSAEEFTSENHHAARKTVMRNMMFARMDADGNGVLSPDEFPGRVQQLRNLDSNQDGEVTRDELRDGMRARRDDSG